MAQDQSWLSNDKEKEDQNEETTAKEQIFVSENTSRGGQRGGRGNQEEHKATVAEKAEELQPDVKELDTSSWAAEEKKETPARGQAREGRGEGRGNRGNRDDNEGGRRGNQQYGGQNRGRGNRQGQEGGGYQGRNYNRNFEGGGGYRGGDQGNRQGGYRGGDRGDRGDRGNRNGGQNNYRRNNDEQGERGGDGYRGRGGDGFRGRGRGGFRHYDNDRNNDRAQTEVKQIIKQVKSQTSEIIPNQRKSYPELVLYIFSAKFSLTLRKLQDFKCKLLIIPFKTAKLELYPGNLIKQSKANYRQKIEAKQEKGQLKNKGQVYFQKAHQICNFQALVFLKVDDTDIQGSFKQGFDQVFKGINNIQSDFSSVVFCISKDIDNPKSAIQNIVRNMQQCQKVKNFFISTSSPDYFLKCIDGFKDQMSQYISQNELYFE